MNKPELSVEFFPPQTEEGAEKLRVVRGRLAVLEPTFFSVTYGAGGSTQERTFATINEIVKEGRVACPHLTCVGATRERIRNILHDFMKAGIRNILALRGDLPSGYFGRGEFHYANELVEFIRAETGNHFRIEIAAYPEWHPEAKSPKDDLIAFKRKVDAGADSAITQYFYNVDAYRHYVDQLQAMGVDIPVIPGIMPIMSFSRLARFSDNCGADIPRWMRKKFESFLDDRDAIRAFGFDVTTDLCERLLAAGAPGLHFYSMNQSAPTLEICRRLGFVE